MIEIKRILAGNEVLFAFGSRVAFYATRFRVVGGCVLIPA
jgi:hypothetical protein